MTKRFTANANTEKSIPPAMSQRNQHLTQAMLRKPATTTRKQFQTTWRFNGALEIGNMQKALETFNQQPCSPESCHSVTLAKVLLFVKAASFFAKRSLQQSHSRPQKHSLFGLQEVVLPSCVKSLLLKQNPTSFYLRNVTSFVFRAGRKVPHCQKWDCHLLPLFALDRVISKLFSISI